MPSVEFKNYYSIILEFNLRGNERNQTGPQELYYSLTEYFKVHKFLIF